MELRQSLREFLTEAGTTQEWQLLLVECVGGCPKPCAVAFDAPGKWRIRFSTLTADDAEDLVSALHLYEGSADGYLTDEALPPGLRGHISARSPTFANPKTLPSTGLPSPFAGGVAPSLHPIPCKPVA
jgi:predicted metal-binding protein